MNEKNCMKCHVFWFKQSLCKGGFCDEYWAEGKADDFINVIKQKWIPCSERLPDKDGKYLVSGNWEGKEEVTICGFYTELGRFGASWRFTIKAWMPSPSPWKGADDDERQV